MGEPLIEKMLGIPEFGGTDFKQKDNDMSFYVRMKECPPVFAATQNWLAIPSTV